MLNGLRKLLSDSLIVRSQNTVDGFHMAWFLLLGQLVSHIALVYGLFRFSLSEWGVVAGLYFVGGCLGGTVTYHRLLSHKSWNAPKWWYYVGSLCGMIFLIGSPLAWSNNHRAHHRYVETEKDPHSPKFLGFASVQWFSMLYTTKSFRYSIANMNTFQLFLHRRYVALHLTYAFTLLVFGGWHLLALVYLVPSAVIWNMASLVNTLNHTKSRFSYRNFDSSKDEAQNNLLTGYLVWGEGWHNNHHYKPAEKSFSHRWWELDIGHLVIKLLEKKSA